MQVDLEEAATRLLQGEVVAIPTETVYGLAASIHFPDALEAIVQLKKRPKTKPLPLLVPNIKTIEPFVDHFPPKFQAFATQFWPGPLTLVIPTPKREGFPTTAFRIPNHPLTLELLKKTGPLATPSANLSGHPPPTTSSEVESTFGPLLPIQDGGPCPKEATPSTILSWDNHQWHLLRPGPLHIPL